MAFELRNEFWGPDYVEGLPVPAWQFLNEEEQEKWRCVARKAMGLRSSKVGASRVAFVTHDEDAGAVLREYLDCMGESGKDTLEEAERHKFEINDKHLFKIVVTVEEVES